MKTGGFLIGLALAVYGAYITGGTRRIYIAVGIFVFLTTLVVPRREES